MTKFKIGVPISKLGDNSVGLTLSYLEYAAKFGEPVLLLPNSEFRSDLSLLILPGGADIDTSRYGEFPSYLTSKPDIHKEYFDRVMLPKYISAGMPILGICRGLQNLAVALGGKLIQHVTHETNKAEDPYKSVHNIKLITDNFYNYKSFTNQIKFGVNSRHHQVVHPKHIGTDMEVIAIHEKDLTIEMMASKSLPIIGVQFHIEDSVDQDTIDLLDNMVEVIIETKKSILNFKL